MREVDVEVNPRMLCGKRTWQYFVKLHEPGTVDLPLLCVNSS